jgi:hypothetical protein
MYGMGTCPSCGFEDHPTEYGNAERARQWRKDHPMPKDPVEPPIAPSLSDADASNLINAILDGSWDSYLNEIVQAVSQRKEKRRIEVTALVEEVYGPSYTITTRK